MSHPLLEVAGVVAVVMAVGVWTVVVLPRPKPAPPAQTIVLDIEGNPTLQAESPAGKSDAERVDELQRVLGEIAAEQKRLSLDLRDAVEVAEGRERKGR